MSAQLTSDATVVLHAVGDVTPRRIDYGEPPESLLQMVAAKIQEADIALCQLEANLSTRGSMQYKSIPTWYGRAHPDNVKSLVHAGFHLVTHASNHCFDYGPESLLETIDVLRENGIEVVGVGKNLEEARRPAFIERKGTVFAFLNFNAVLPEEYEARDDKPGCAPIRVATYYQSQEFQAGTPPKIITIPLEEDVVAMEQAIKQARSRADIVIVSMHWGIHHVAGMLANYEFTVGHRAIEAGADMILGTHAHLIKGVEIYQGKVIFHNLGNFAQETPHHLTPPPGAYHKPMTSVYRQYSEERGTRYGGPHDKKYTIMVKCEVKDKKIQKVSFFPGWINEKAEPRFVNNEEPEFQEVLEYITKWSRELGTELTADGNEIIVWET